MKRISPLSVWLILAIITLSFTRFSSPSGYVVGDKVEDIALKNVDGRMVSLNDYPNAKGFIVIFTCNHCPYAQSYEDRIVALHKKYAAQGFPVIAINPNDPEIVPEDSYEEMQKRAVEKSFPFPYLFDEKQAALGKYGASRTPHVFLLDKDRIVRYIGAIDDNAESAKDARKKYVENAISALNKGKKPEPNFTRAVGCTIKRK
jgi:peroxiredoxin